MNPSIPPFPLALGGVTVEGASVYYGLIGTDEPTNEMSIYRETTTIPLVENQCFGIEFGLLTASRLEAGIWLNLSYEMHYYDRAKPDVQRVARQNIELEINTYLFVWQRLDTAEELVPGRWTISVLHAGQVLFSQAFDVMEDID